jgi:type II secretory pathway pseudopilin PulG
VSARDTEAVPTLMRRSVGEDRCPKRPAAGFSIIEAVMVLLIVATVIGALTPGVVRTLSHARINRAANVVAAQFYLAQSMAGRQRRPVTLTVNATTKTITIADAVSPFAALAVRQFGTQSEFRIASFVASRPSVYILPNGMANAADTVSVSDGTYTQRVCVSRAGQIRILR